MLEAIDQADYEMMEDELGDLLFQAVFHAQIASETGYFNIYDVIQGITDKLIRRHSHVFQNDIAATPDAVVELWEKNKQSERTLSDRLRAIPRVSPLHYGMKAIKLLGHKPQGGLTRASDEELVEQLMEIVAEATKRDLPLDLLLSEKVSQMVEDVEQG